MRTLDLGAMSPIFVVRSLRLFNPFYSMEKFHMLVAMKFFKVVSYF